MRLCAIFSIHYATGIPKLNDRRTYHLSIYAYKRSRLDEYLDNKPIRTRQRDAPVLKCFKSDYKVVDRSVNLQTANVWNKMNTNLSNTDNFEAFKSIQKNWLIGRIPVVIP